MADSKASAPEPSHVHPALPLFGGELAKWEAVKARDTLSYQMGYGNEFATEAVKDALPKLGNTPMRAPHGLYAEQVSGTSFTTPRVHNRKVWMYKVRPSAAHAPMRPYTKNPRFFNDFNDSTSEINPNQLRWKPFPIPSADEAVVDFIDGVMTLGGAGCPAAKAGCAVHIYACNASMAETRRAFCNSDGDLLIVPQQTPLLLRTELGKLRVAPGEFAVVPRGIKFAVDLEDAESGTCPARAPARGYICEVYDSHFIIPDLGPIGANGLAHPRHFAAPVAAFEDEEYPAPDAAAAAAADLPAESKAFHLVQKFVGKLFAAPLQSSPFDVVAWSGNYTPFKYDLAAFNTVNSVSYDHLDPSIFTVLTAQTTSPGVAACDFVVFPPRYAVQSDTFRPPYYHRNCMTEFMGNIMGQYDAKPEGFVPGSASLHSCMMGHGPDADTYAKFSNDKTAPQGPVLMNKGDLAFMFESTYVFKLSKWANAPETQQTEYYRCWAGLKSEYDANSK